MLKIYKFIKKVEIYEKELKKREVNIKKQRKKMKIET